MLDAAEAVRLATSLGSLGSSLAKSQLSGVIPGNVYWVDSANGMDVATQPGDFDQPFDTLAYAITRATASQGDVIFVKPGHAETTTAIAASKAGIKIVGLGYGRNRPAFTATTASSDLISVTGANVHIENVRFVGAASGCTALLNIGAADFVGRNIVFEHGAAPLIAVTVVAASHRFVLEDCQWFGTAAGADICIDLEFGAGLTTDNWRVIRPYAAYGGSAGLDLGFLRMMISGTGYAIEDAKIIGFDTVAIDINSSTLAIGDGIITGWAASSGATTWANTNDAGGAIFAEFYVSDSPGAQGKRWPAATPD